MRIAIFWEQESWGGVDSHLLELLSEWPAKDADNFLLIYNKGNQGFARIEKQLSGILNVKTKRFLSLSSNSLSHLVSKWRIGFLLKIFLYFFKPVLFLISIRQLTIMLRQCGMFDLILANNGGYPGAWGALAALKAARNAGIPARVLLVHHAANKPGFLMHWFEFLVDRMVNKVAGTIVCVSQATKNQLLANRFFNDELMQIRVIHNGLSINNQSLPKREKVKIPELEKLQNRRFLIGLVGRVEAYKGHEDLFFALARLKADERKHFSVAFIGKQSPHEEKNLEGLAEQLGIGDQVHFTGYLDYPSLQIIQQLDLLLMLTRSFEGYGLSVAEAMIMGVPVLATRVGAIPEYLDTANSLLVNPCAPSEIAGALRYFLKNQNIIRHKAALGRKQALNSGRRMVEEYQFCFRESFIQATGAGKQNA